MRAMSHLSEPGEIMMNPYARVFNTMGQQTEHWNEG